MKISKITIFTFIFPLMLWGCKTTSKPADVKPDIALPSSYSLDVNDRTISDTPWWHSLERPTLNRLISQSLGNNYDIKQAIARVDQARALTRQTESDLYPKIDALAEGNREWEGSDGQRGTARLGVNLQWEIDAFNRIRNATKADIAETTARVEDVKALKLFTSIEVANAYFSAVAAQQTLDLLNQQVQTDKDLLELLELRFDQGIGTNVEVLQQKSRVTESLSLIPVAQSQRRVSENRLDVLMGHAPDGQNRVTEDETLDFTASLPRVSVPADILVNRPDIRAAKAALIAADFDTAEAIANRLPQITLDGSYLLSDNAAYSGPVSMIMGTFVAPLLDWGQRKAEVERNEAVYQERLAAFTQLYIEAVGDVENALYQENRQRDFLERLDQRRIVLDKTVQETEARYGQGIDDYLPVLNALQELRQVERAIISERLNLIALRISLYSAIGGAITPSTHPEELL